MVDFKLIIVGVMLDVKGVLKWLEFGVGGGDYVDILVIVDEVMVIVYLNLIVKQLGLLVYWCDGGDMCQWVGGFVGFDEVGVVFGCGFLWIVVWQKFMLMIISSVMMKMIQVVWCDYFMVVGLVDWDDLF